MNHTNNQVNNKNPLITYVLFTYNQEKYVSEAVKGALAQTYSPLEIIISDDCSTDKTFEILQKTIKEYTGPHKIKIIKNQNNVGICDHFNLITDIAKGNLIVVAAGDDISESNRVEEIAKCWNKYKPSAIYSNAIKIDEKNEKIGYWNISTEYKDKKCIKIRNKNEYIVPKFYGAGAAYDKNILIKYGPLPINIRNEDQNLAWRAIMTNGICYIDSELVRYRIHDNNLSFWIKLEKSKSLDEIILLRIEAHNNQLINYKYILGYAINEFGKNSKIVRKINKIIDITFKKIKFPLTYFIIDTMSKYLSIIIYIFKNINQKYLNYK